MTTRFHSLKGIAALGLVVLTCAGLASCGGGGGSGPVSGGGSSGSVSSGGDSGPVSGGGSSGSVSRGGGSGPVSGGGGSGGSGDQMLIVPPSPNVTEAQGHPDLVVGAPTVSDSSPAAGAGFTLSAAVRNDGDGASAATTLRYYRSTDATITTSDTEVGTDAVAGLADAGSSSESVDLTAPASPGTYYYGACVDTVTDESDTTNNCSASVPVTVPEPPGQPDLVETPPPLPGHPDLVVASPSVNDSNPAAGAGFTLSAAVRNDGDGASAATTLRYYRSTDATITTSDTEVGTDAVAGLADAGSSSESVDLTAPASPGTYYYGACVDTVTDESDTTNNCSASVLVTVPEPPGHPDLVVGAPTVSDRGPAGGARFTLSAAVRNDGDGASAATTLRYYRSTDATITTSDTAVGTDAVATLAASGRGGESVELTAPSSSGTYYYGACVDAVTAESDTTNNCSASVPVTVSDDGEPATEVHLFTPIRVEEGGATLLIVMAWTSGDRPPTVSIPVRVWLVEGTAKEGVDFPPLSQSVVFNPSDFTFNGSRYETHQVSFPFTILDDTEAEGDETFGGTIMLESDLPFVEVIPAFPDQGSITIFDND